VAVSVVIVALVVIHALMCLLIDAHAPIVRIIVLWGVATPRHRQRHRRHQ
jgi:hypothetical protein